MAVLTSQRIGSLYERFRSIDITFTKEIILVTGLVPQEIYLKCAGDFWPCGLQAASFEGARVTCASSQSIMEKLKRANNLVTLRFCFKNAGQGGPVSFFVAAKVTGSSPWEGSDETALYTLQFTQRPPDDLIEIVGKVLEAGVNAERRKKERVQVSPETIRKLRLSAKESDVFIQGVPRRCIVRDISFSGAKVIMMGVAKFLENKEAALRVDFEDPPESFLLKGKFIRSEDVEGRNDLIALAIAFDEAAVPMGFKVRFNDYLGSARTDRASAQRAGVGAGV